MEILLNPNIAYIIIVSAAMLALMTVIIPGTGIPEVGLLICMALTWYEFTRYQPNLWALLILILGILPFFGALRLPHLRLFLLPLAILLISGGSVFLFVDGKGMPAVNPILAGLVTILCAFYIWIAVDRSLKAQSAKPYNDPDQLLEKIGETRTHVYKSGSVQVGGELWSARSEISIPIGCKVRILQRDGFVLTVEKYEK